MITESETDYLIGVQSVTNIRFLHHYGKIFVMKGIRV